MNRKAFTLIELLAVIVVLAILLVIAVPRVLDVVESSRVESFRVSTEQLVRSAKDRTVVDTLVDPPPKKLYILNNKAFVGNSIPFDGELPESGKIYVVSDKLAAIALKNGDYCAIMQLGEEKVRIEKGIDCELSVPGIVPDSCFTYGTYGQDAFINAYDNGCSKDVIIPSSINGYNVVAIQSSSFLNKQLTSVEIPSSVKLIEWNAFENNQLETVVFSNNLEEIGFRAFANNNIKAVTLSNTIKNIRAECFQNNEIESLTIPNSVTDIQWSAFKNNHISKLEIGSGITSIGAYSFSNNNLEEITIPPTVTFVTEGAFSNDLGVSSDFRNNVKKVTISSGVNVEGAAISQSFFEFYDWTSGKAGGVYTAPSQSGPWTKQ